MAFVKLLPPEASALLSPAAVVAALENEFRYVHSDSVAGRDYVGKMIAATERFSDVIPGKDDRLAQLRHVQPETLLVQFGDAPDITASVCVMPGSELFFGSVEEVSGAARPLVDRAARVLRYSVHEA